MANIILDSETTGLGKRDQVLELAIIHAETAETLFYQKIKPTCPIQPAAENIHRISAAMLNHASPWPTYHQQICDILNSAEKIIAYNAPFDLRLIQQTAAAHNLPGLENLMIHDLMVPYADLAKIEYNHTYGSWKWQKLGDACRQQGIDLSDLGLHGSLDDCRATQRLYLRMRSGSWGDWNLLSFGGC